MADPEIGLGEVPTDNDLDSNFPGEAYEKAGTGTTTPDNQDKNETSSQVSNTTLTEESPLVYYYLTFETPLPIPVAQANNEGTPLPHQPDLKKYTSPFQWSPARKNFTIAISCIATMATAYTAGSYSPAATQLKAYWNVGEVAILVGITTFCFGFAIAPMLLAPFSEINGRYPVFVGAGIVYVIGQICCAVTQIYPGMLLARFATGVGSSVFSTMVGGVVSDLYHSHERNTPMALFSGAALAGTGLGPLVSGFVAQNTTWRWVFWLQVITCGVLILVFALFFRETRGSIILSRKAARLNQWYEELEALGHYGLLAPQDSTEKSSVQRIRWRVKSDEERESLSKMVGISLYRPFHLLVTEPVVFFFSLWVSFAWAVLYLTFGAISLVFKDVHNFSIEQSGAVFAAMTTGSLLATLLSISQERVLTRLAKDKSKPRSKLVAIYGDLSATPEGRLYFACVEAALLPIGLFWFGWSLSPDIHWIVPTIAVGCATMGIFSVYLATFNYFADTYHRYASSALAAQSFCRNILGGIFPLVTPALFNNLGFGAASSLLGGIGCLLSIVPWVLVFYGPRIRARSKFASEIM